MRCIRQVQKCTLDNRTDSSIYKNRIFSKHYKWLKMTKRRCSSKIAATNLVQTYLFLWCSYLHFQYSNQGIFVLVLPLLSKVHLLQLGKLLFWMDELLLYECIHTRSKLITQVTEIVRQEICQT